MSDPAPLSKPSNPIWLLAPLGVVITALVIVCAAWWAVRLRLEGAIDDRMQALQRQGCQVGMQGLGFSGFPYRMAVRVDQFRLLTPSGWGATIRGLKAEALLFDLDHWVFVARDGLTLSRPIGGDLVMSGATVRASLAGLDAPTPRFAFEGTALIFKPAAGARPFSLASADRLELYTRTGLQDRRAAEVLVRLDGARFTRGATLSPLIGDHRLNAGLSLRILRVDAMAGADWTRAGQAWAAANGRVEIDPTTPPGADLRLSTSGGRLRFGVDGRPTGALPLTLTLEGRPPINAPLSFGDGATRLGPLTLGPVPRIF